MIEIVALKGSDSFPEILNHLSAIDELLKWLCSSGRIRAPTLQEGLRRTSEVRRFLEDLQTRSGEYQRREIL